MHIFKDPETMQRWALEQRVAGQIIGLVPTMGYLHDGHLSLIKTAMRECDITVVSIFVNPTQFGPNEDFVRYPRDNNGDLAMCEEHGVDVVFMPEIDAMYAQDASVYVMEKRLALNLCGASRPNHFSGVCTVVAKLFNIVQPHEAFFGQKDYQQAAIIRRMVCDLNFAIDIRVLPIMRDRDGLALSSRNIYLSPDEHQRALTLNRSLQQAHELFFAGENRASMLKQSICELLVAEELKIDYVEIVDSETLVAVNDVEMGNVMMAAVYCGKTRLIDNCIV
jgi:pantoate--beta-alanine ligase